MLLIVKIVARITFVRVQKILWLQIPMRDSEVVKIGQSLKSFTNLKLKQTHLKDHFDISNGFFLVERFRNNSLEEFFPRSKFEHHVDSFI